MNIIKCKEKSYFFNRKNNRMQYNFYSKQISNIEK